MNSLKSRFQQIKEDILKNEAYANNIPSARGGEIADQIEYIKTTIKPLIDKNRNNEALKLFRTIYGHKNDNETEMIKFVKHITQPIFI